MIKLPHEMTVSDCRQRIERHRAQQDRFSAESSKYRTAGFEATAKKLEGQARFEGLAVLGYEGRIKRLQQEAVKFKTGTLCKLAGGRSVRVASESSAPYVDESAMSATAVISTVDRDRVGDILLPYGCSLDNYRKNPIVLWEHGLTNVSMPIGTSESPDGELAIEINDDQIKATCYFSQTLKEAQQVFELVAEGIVKAASVRANPITTERGGEISEWDLEEWSWVCVGCNPEAVAKTISRNRLAGSTIAPAIRRSLLRISRAF
jgi:hypothetical protein